MLKIGIISAWHVHTNDYARQIVQSGKAEIVAMWDEDVARGQKWAEENGCAFVADYDALLNNAEIDAVVVNAPTTDHPALIAKAVAAGKHVFTEKLLAVSTAEAKELCAQIENAGITFTISLPQLSDPYVQYAKSLVDSGALGKVTGARFRRSHGGVSDNWLPAYWFDTSKSGGGAMMDLGAHPIYVLAYLFGAPKRISAVMNAPYNTSADENAIAVCEFENGVIATAETAFVTFGVPDIIEVYGTEGAVFINGKDVKLSTKVTSALGAPAITPSQLPERKASPIMQFVDACLNGTGTPEALGTDAALVMTQMIEASYQSDKTGQTIIF